MTTLHLMVGLPCSGKTTLAKKIECESGALRLTPDDWHRFLYGQDAADLQHDQRHNRIEALQWVVAESALKSGLDVILDFGFWTRGERDTFRSKATELGVETRMHFLDVPTETLLERLQIRNQQSPSEITIIPVSMMKEYIPRFEAPDDDEWATNPDAE